MNDTFSLLQKYTGISKYSQSEVITPQWVVSDMVDLLPQEVFNPNATFFDPAVKSGRFLIEIYHRLMASDLMKQAFPNEQDRHKHIIEKQLFGFATSPTAATVVRKTLYDDPLSTGNIRFTSDKLTKERVQGAFNNMRFDVVIGNPPYNNDIYLDFVTLGHSLASQYTCMITPAKWQAKGGDKNEKFRKDIVPYMSHVVFYPSCSDVFEIKIVDGISWYLITRTKQDKVTIVNKCKYQKLLESTQVRNIQKQQPLLNSLNSIIEKIGQYAIFDLNKISKNKKYMVYGNRNTVGARGMPNVYQAIGMISYASGNIKLIGNLRIDENTAINRAVFSTADTIWFTSDCIETCKSFKSWIETKFVQFFLFGWLSTRMLDNSISFGKVPDPGAFDHIFTDDELYKKYRLAPEEINIIESVIKERKL